MGFSRVFLESGLTLTRSFLEKDLIDDFILFVSNNKLNSNGNADFRKTFDKFLKNTKHTNENVNLLGDKLISYKIK